MVLIALADHGVSFRLPDGCKVLGLDIDNTITAYPEQFSAMSHEARDDNVKVVIITSRSEQGRRETMAGLEALGIYYDSLHFLPPMSWANEHCPHKQLDWYRRWLWYKIKIAGDEGVTHFFDDDSEVLKLLQF